MKRKLVMHGMYIIRVERDEHGSAGMIDIQSVKTQEKTILDIDNEGVFRQRDRRNPGAKVVAHALKIYDLLGEKA